MTEMNPLLVNMVEDIVIACAPYHFLGCISCDAFSHQVPVADGTLLIQKYIPLV
jgi:hypothetical protein